MAIQAAANEKHWNAQPQSGHLCYAVYTQGTFQKMGQKECKS